jgi:hypothetical protein
MEELGKRRAESRCPTASNTIYRREIFGRGCGCTLCIRRHGVLCGRESDAVLCARGPSSLHIGTWVWRARQKSLVEQLPSFQPLLASPMKLTIQAGDNLRTLASTNGFQDFIDLCLDSFTAFLRLG